MKITVKHLFVILGLCALMPTGEAQNTVVRRSSTENARKTDNTGLTVRAQTQYGNHADAGENAPWTRGIYRQLDLQKKKNLPLYFPEEIIDGQKNLFRILLELVASNQIKVYEYLDGREIFNEEYEVKTEDMLDRFHILYEVKEGRTARRNTYIIEESDVPCNEVLSYYVKENWIFDPQESTCRPVIEAICPVLHRVGDFGGEAVRYPMFWVKYDDVRPFLTQQYIMNSDFNNARNYTYDDFFTLRMFDGEIYKTQNLQNMSLVQLYPTPEAQDSARNAIEQELRQFDKSLWVSNPDNQPKQTKQQARAAKSETEAEAAPTAEPAKEKSSSVRSSRGSSQPAAAKSKPAKTKTPKASSGRSSSGGSAPVHSVRRTH